MVREYPALVITDSRDLSESSGNLAFAHLNFCPGPRVISFSIMAIRLRGVVFFV